MQNRFTRYSAYLTTAFVIASLCLFDLEAQTRRKRRPSRVTRPVITNPAINPPAREQTPATGGEKIISTADDTAEEADQGADPGEQRKSSRKPRAASGDEEMQQTINTLSNQVNRLADKLSQMQENDRSLLDMERLSRAEQRAEGLRSQQIEVESKLADLNSKVEEAEYALKPENIERATATFGTTRPEDARESRRRQLESEKLRAQAQIRILEVSRSRLEAAVANADAEVDLLRRRSQVQQQQDSSPSPQSDSRPANSPPRPK